MIARLPHLALLLTLAGPAATAGVAVPLDEQQLAGALCGTCHAVAPGETVGPYDGAPSFTAIAADERFTRHAIRDVLRTDHPPLPTLRVSRAELDAILDYIESLRDP